MIAAGFALCVIIPSALLRLVMRAIRRSDEDLAADEFARVIQSVKL